MGCTNSSPTPSPRDAPARKADCTTSKLSDAQRWQIFNELETIDEAETLVLANFMQSLMDHAPVPEAFEDINAAEDEDPSKMGVLKVDGLSVIVDETDAGESDQNYDLAEGKEMTPAMALDLLNLYKRGGKLSQESMQKILRHFYKSLIKLQNVNHIDLSGDMRLTVVGDIHGQLPDLFHILETSGWPTAANKYLFNGDFVDRGQSGVEVMTLLLALQAAFPKSVFLNRGNHECRAICAVYGFQQECEQKYSRIIFDQFCEIFKYLPIASVVNKEVFVVHGGLFHRGNVKISDIETIERQKYEGDLEDPSSPENVKDPRGYDLRCLMLEALWSDPNPDPRHTVAPNPRGAGVSFGISSVNQFLQGNKLSLIVRSHECVKNGFHWPFKGEKLCTLFSASNYEGRGNMAAFMVFSAQPFTDSKKIGGSGTLFYSICQFTMTEGEDGLDECNHLLHDLIRKRAKALHLNFTAADPDGSGLISKQAWADIMRSVTKVNITWLPMADAIIPATALSSSDVCYAKFLDAFRNIEGKDADEVDLYVQRQKLEAIFRFFDTDGNGSISREEFKNGCGIINKILPPEKQITDPDAIMTMMDFDGSDSIDVNEFFETFRILDAKDGVVDGVISVATNRRDDSA